MPAGEAALTALLLLWAALALHLVPRPPPPPLARPLGPEHTRHPQPHTVAAVAPATVPVDAPTTVSITGSAFPTAAATVDCVLFRRLSHSAGRAPVLVSAPATVHAPHLATCTLPAAIPGAVAPWCIGRAEEPSCVSYGGNVYISLRVNNWYPAADATVLYYVDESAPPPADTAREQLWAELDALQNGDCRTTPAVLFAFDDSSAFKHAGFGAQLHHLSVILSFAFRHGRMLVFRDADRWNYGGYQTCSVGFMCFFERPGPCSEADTGGLHGRGPFSVDSDRVVPSTLAQIRDRTIVPEKYAHLGLRWWRLQLLAYLWRPLPRVRKFVQDAQERLGLARVPYIAVNIRHGDRAYAEALDMYPAEDFARVVRAVSDLDRVFLVSDDPAIDQAWPAAPSWDVVFDPLEKRLNGSDCMKTSATSCRRMGVGDGGDPQHTLDVIKNIELMADAPGGLVGTFSSNFARLAFELAAHRRFKADEPVHGYSLDWRWHVAP